MWQSSSFALRLWKKNEKNQKLKELTVQIYFPNGLDNLDGRYRLASPSSQEPGTFAASIQEYRSGQDSFIHNREGDGFLELKVRENRISGALKIPFIHLQTEEPAFEIEGEFSGPWGVSCFVIDRAYPDASPPTASRWNDQAKQAPFCQQFRDKPWPAGYR